MCRNGYVSEGKQVYYIANSSRRYINGLAIHNAPLNSGLHPSHYPFVQAAIEAAITVLKTGVESKNYQRNLRFAIVSEIPVNPHG